MPEVPSTPAFRLVALESIDSTNEEAKRRAAAGAPDGELIWAKVQTAGRGRGDRTWVSIDGNLYFSVLLRPEEPPDQAMTLTFVAANAVASALEAVLPPGAPPVRCKWPNDVLIGGRKASGILLEAGAEAGRLVWLAVGVGVNIVGHPPKTMYPATSLMEEGARDVDAALVLEACADHFAQGLETWRAQGFAPAREAWLARAEGLGDEITVRLAQETVEGTFEGLDEDGTLLLVTPSGRRRVAAGDVFLKPSGA